MQAAWSEPRVRDGSEMTWFAIHQDYRDEHSSQRTTIFLCLVLGLPPSGKKVIATLTPNFFECLSIRRLVGRGLIVSRTVPPPPAFAEPTP